MISNAKNDLLLQAVPLTNQEPLGNSDMELIEIHSEKDKGLKVGYVRPFNIIRVSKEQREFTEEKITSDSMHNIYLKIKNQIEEVNI